jgi:hypothetical protein
LAGTIRKTAPMAFVLDYLPESTRGSRASPLRERPSLKKAAAPKVAPL